MTTTLLLGDCLERMAELPDKSIDLILADLPYGTTACKWDEVIPLEQLWAQYRRMLKPGRAVVLTATQPFTSTLVMSNPRWFRYEWIWKKRSPSGFLDANRKPLKAHESILVFCERAAPYYPQGVLRRRRRRRRRTSCTTIYDSYGHDWITTGENFPRSVLEFPKSPAVGHPTAKPVPMMEYLINTYTQEAETVLDNTMGSGSTGVACVNTNRSFVGIERDEEYFATAERRIREAFAIREAS